MSLIDTDHQQATLTQDSPFERFGLARGCLHDAKRGVCAGSRDVHLKMNESEPKVISPCVLPTSGLTDDFDSSAEWESPTSIYSRTLHKTVPVA